MLRLLVALDFSECSRQALSTALAIAERAAPAELLVLTVLERHEDEIQSLNDLERNIDELRRMVTALRGGVSTVPGVAVHYAALHGQPAEQIVAAAATHQADAVVLGTHGRTGLDRLLVGSVAEMVVRTAPCSVLTVKPRRAR